MNTSTSSYIDDLSFEIVRRDPRVIILARDAVIKILSEKSENFIKNGIVRTSDAVLEVSRSISDLSLRELIDVPLIKEASYGIVNSIIGFFPLILHDPMYIIYYKIHTDRLWYSVPTRLLVECEEMKKSFKEEMKLFKHSFIHGNLKWEKTHSGVIEDQPDSTPTPALLSPEISTKALRDALHFYARPSNWEAPAVKSCGCKGRSQATKDAGAKARLTLAKTS